MNREKINQERLLIFKTVLFICRIQSISLIALLCFLAYTVTKSSSSPNLFNELYEANFLKHFLFRIFLTGVLAWIAERYAQRANKEIKEIKEKLIKP